MERENDSSVQSQRSLRSDCEHGGAVLSLVVYLQRSCSSWSDLSLGGIVDSLRYMYFVHWKMLLTAEPAVSAWRYN